MEEYLALLPIILPIIGAVLTFVLSRYSEKLLGYITVIYSAFLFFLFTAYIIAIYSGSLKPFSCNSITWDLPGAVIACLVAFIGTLIIAYSFAYKHKAHFSATYFIMYFLLMGMMNGLACTYNVIIMLIFLEAATIISAILILFGRTKRAIKATYVYLAISIFEVLLVVFGAFILYNSTGTLDLSLLEPGALSEQDMLLLALLFLFGFGTKAGLLPLGIVWLPPAHSEAPPPISATMSGILVMASIIAMIKAVYPFYAMSDVDTLILIIAGLGLINMFVGIIAALFSKDLKRLLAYSTVSSIGYITLGFGLATPAAVYGSLFYIANHMLYKGCLFLIAGALILRVSTRQIPKMGGLIRKMPLTALSFLIAALAISGVPLLNGFAGKELIYEGSVEAGYPVLFTLFGIEFTVFAILGWIVSILTFICFIRAFYAIFLGEPKPESETASDPPAVMLVPILIMAGLCIVIGIYPDLLSGVLQSAADTLLGLTGL